MLVPEGFWAWGLVLGWVALLRPGSWLVAILAGIASLLAGVLARHLPGTWVLLPAIHLAVGLFGHDWRRWELRQAGCIPGPIVAGRHRDAALLRLLDAHPALLGQAMPAATPAGEPA